MLSLFPGVARLATDVIFLVNDISSAQRLVDLARVVYGFGVKYFVATKVYGAAASSGVPEVTRLALKQGKSFSVLSSVKDAVEVFSPDKVVVISKDYGTEVDLPDYLRRLSGKILFVVSGIDVSPGRDVVGIGEAIYPSGLEQKLPPTAEATLILYYLNYAN